MPYDQNDTDYPATEDAAENPNPESDSDAGEEGATILIPKSALEGKEFGVGEEIVLTIVKDTGEELLAKYAPEKPSKPKSTMDESMGKMDEMMGEGGGY